MNTTRIALALLLATIAPLASAQPSGREQLRGALEEYYAHVVAERLEMSAEQTTALRSRLDRMVTARHAAMAGVRQAQERLQEELRAEAPNPAHLRSLLAEVLDSEARGEEGLRVARRELVTALSPRQQATFVVSEDAYRRAVMAHLRELRTGRAGKRPESPPDSPWRRARDEGELAAPGAEPPDTARQSEVAESLTLLLAVQLRSRAQVPLERLVELLPLLERSVKSQLAVAVLERTAQRTLSDALESGASDEDLRRRVNALLDEEDTLQRDQLDARKAIVDGLEPVAAARFLQLQETFRRQGPQRLRMLQRALAGEDEGSPAREGGRDGLRRQRPR